MDRSSTSLLVSVLWVASVICAAPVTHTDAHRLFLDTTVMVKMGKLCFPVSYKFTVFYIFIQKVCTLNSGVIIKSLKIFVLCLVKCRWI